MCNVIILIKAKLEFPLCNTVSFFINSVESLLVSENIRTAAKWQLKQNSFTLFDFQHLSKAKM